MPLQGLGLDSQNGSVNASPGQGCGVVAPTPMVATWTSCMLAFVQRRACGDELPSFASPRGAAERCGGAVACRHRSTKHVHRMSEDGRVAVSIGDAYEQLDRASRDSESQWGLTARTDQTEAFRKVLNHRLRVLRHCLIPPRVSRRHTQCRVRHQTIQQTDVAQVRSEE